MHFFSSFSQKLRSLGKTTLIALFFSFLGSFFAFLVYAAGTGNFWSLYFDQANGRIGLNESSPAYRVDVRGETRFQNSITIQDGTQGNGKVLTSDASGKATWSNTPGPQIIVTPYTGTRCSGKQTISLPQCANKLVARITPFLNQAGMYFYDCTGTRVTLTLNSGNNNTINGQYLVPVCNNGDIIIDPFDSWAGACWVAGATGPVRIDEVQC